MRRMNMTSSYNLSNQTANLNCLKILKAVDFYDYTRKINIFATVLIIIVGLIGNTLAVIVFIQKRFRLRSPGVFLLCLAISDGLFLLTHFFEDTLRTYLDVYVLRSSRITPFAICDAQIPPIKNVNITSANSTTHSMLLSINITDQFEISCRLINFLRYFLRFISAYIITVFTIQRAIAIYFPLYQNKFSSTVLAWKIVIGLVIIGSLLCLFVPFLFELKYQQIGSKQFIYCDSNKSTPQLYFVTTIIYITLIMFIPISTIIISNSFIIFQICRAGKKRSLMITGNYNATVKDTVNTSSNDSVGVDKNCKYHALPAQNGKAAAAACQKKTYTGTTDNTYTYNTAIQQHHHHHPPPAAHTHESLSNKQRKKLLKFQIDSQKVTRMLIIMSLSYAILNLPYFITWCLFYYTQAINKGVNVNEQESFSYSRYLFGFINLTEIFYVLNYGIHFFLYCASGKQFRTQLKYSLMSSRKRKSHL